MNRISLSFLILLGMSASLFGQTKPGEGDISLGFRISGLSNISLAEFSTDAFDTPELLGRYFLTDNLALRARLGFNIGSTSNDFSDSYLDSTRFAQARLIDSAVQVTESFAAFTFSPGVEYHFEAEGSKLDPYVAGEILFSIRGNSSSETDREYTQTDAAGVQLYGEDLNIKTDVDGGIGIGLNLLGGFNYFFTDKIALGAEYGIGFLYVRDGGQVRIETVGSINPSGDPANLTPVDIIERFDQVNTSTTLDTRGRGAINLSIFF